MKAAFLVIKWEYNKEMSSFLVVREKFCLLIAVVSLIFLFSFPHNSICGPKFASNFVAQFEIKLPIKLPYGERYLTNTFRGQKPAIPKFACSNGTLESEICKLAVSASSFAACWRFGSTNVFRYGLYLKLAARMRPRRTGTFETRWLNLRPIFLAITSPPFNH